MKFSEIKSRLGEIIVRDERHRDYQTVCDHATLYRKLLTGEDMDSLMQQFVMRESTELFKQRIRITQHITKTVSQNVMDVYRKIPRSNSVQRFIGYTASADDNEKLKELNKKLEGFWGKLSLDSWMNTRWIDLNFLDPNSFIVVEWGAFDNTKERAKPYPYEVYSKNAIMYEYKDNVLQYLVSHEIKNKWVTDASGITKQKDYNVYTFYGDKQTVQFVQIINETNINEIRGLFPNNSYFIGNEYFRKSLNTEEYYEIIAYKPHNLGFVPAECVGVLNDLATDGRTYVSPLDKGIPILMKIVKANSELDLTMTLHAFPQKLQYLSPCKEMDCHGGKLLDNSICGHCHGTGYEIATSSQESITLALPKTPEDMINLTELVHYVYPPVDLVKFQDEYVTNLTYQVKEAIFNTEIFSKQQVAETATGKNISLQNVYDALYPIAVGYSTDWEWFVNTIASITDLKEGLICFYKFSKDFKLKDLTQLYLDLKTVGDARASEFIKSSIEDDIARIVYSESQRDLLKYEVQKKWFPFNGKTSEEITAIIATNNLVPNDMKILYANFAYIFDMIELEGGDFDFYQAPKDKQWEIIKKKILEIANTIKAEMPKEPLLDNDTDNNNVNE